MNKKAFLIILDGWGHGPNPEVSAIDQANTAFIDGLYQKYPNAELTTYGEEVGLPVGQMGNSEVGHLNIGAGRIIYQELARINNSIETGAFDEIEVLAETLSSVKENNGRIHLMGLLSDGGVHSHIDHLLALCKLSQSYNLSDVFIHAFLDGRDTDPKGGFTYVKKLLEHIADTPIKLASIIGRYYAMDRDKRWERTKKAYDLLVHKIAELSSSDPLKTLLEKYDSGITDEFMSPITIQSEKDNSIRDGDTVICFNFRTDRPRQIYDVLSQTDREDFGMKPLNLQMISMTEYDESFKNISVVFEKENLTQTLGHVISDHGLNQLRIAETEKYPHVTFFFSGGSEAPLKGEHRILINSPKVATYDLQPEMSAYEMTNAVHKYIESDHPEFIILNYANADMVGHTGVFKAAVKAVETLDACLESLIPLAIKNNYFTIIIADHGNSDCMIKEDGSPHTAHTMNPVPIIIIDPSGKTSSVKDGKLADIAPTILGYLGIEAPVIMTGSNLAQ